MDPHPPTSPHRVVWLKVMVLGDCGAWVGFWLGCAAPWLGAWIPAPAP